MRLKRLSSNMRSFHEIIFKEGLNIIVGQQANPDDANKRNTYNGVGKSLIIYLIHFCLGSNNIKAFEDKIPGWEFKLEFLIGDSTFTTLRNTSTQSDIYLNGEKLSLTKFRAFMLKEVFGMEDKINNLTFNTLFPRFIRRDRECYVQYDTFIKKEQEYSKMLNNSYLLGLDIKLITEKQRLRSSQNKTMDLKKSIEQDPIIKEHFSNNEDTDIEILDLEENLKKLKHEISVFKVASNYKDIERAADEKTFEIRQLENKRTLINNALRSIKRSLKIKADISEQKVINLYHQAKIDVPEMVIKKLDEAINFQKSLLKSRKQRLSKELIKKQSELNVIDKEIEDAGRELDQSLRYLNDHGALEDYTALNKKMNDMTIKLDRLNEYQEILKTYKKKIRDIQTNLTKENVTVEDYLEDNEDLLEEIMITFRDLSKSFYDKPGGITVKNNDGENTIRFNIHAKIQDDSSDGVNEVKIFCYDMTMLLLKQNHKVEFLFHDSRLYSNMDPRQRYNLFKLVHEKTLLNNIQYIATINQDILLSFKDLLKPDEYSDIIEKNIVLRLTDESAKSKLLGIQVDMDYEK